METKANKIHTHIMSCLPTLGVVPPSARFEHSSILFAPVTTDI